jgi:hypothetical protein
MRPTHYQLACNDQVGFATTAKAMLLVAAVAGGGFLAAGKSSREAPVPTPGIGETIIAAQATISDPDAELRPWLREAQPPTF